jgi:(p)ppGpp synthase/HD superfamily hydrolase
MIEKAKKIATKAHKGQRRKFGSEPYISHPESVAKRVKGKEAKAIAWLHDVVEDTDKTLDDLSKDFPEKIVHAIDCLTRRDGETYKQFVLRAMNNPLAKIVKIEDIKHNLSTIPDSEKGLIKRWEDALEVLNG